MLPLSKTRIGTSPSMKLWPLLFSGVKIKDAPSSLIHHARTVQNIVRRLTQLDAIIWGKIQLIVKLIGIHQQMVRVNFFPMILVMSVRILQIRMVQLESPASYLPWEVVA